ncbi:MAG TPA: hypothetical protein EYP04_12985, partial [Anaerolineae bacterium]|nr:hypothetical protein [Anaerolineae bacterium]
MLQALRRSRIGRQALAAMGIVSLIPLVALGMYMLGQVAVMNRHFVAAERETLLSQAKVRERDTVRDQAALIDAQFGKIEDAIHHVTSFAETLYAHPESFGPYPYPST